MGYQVIPTGVEGSISHGVANATKLWSDYVANKTAQQMEESRRAGEMEQLLGGRWGVLHPDYEARALNYLNRSGEKTAWSPGGRISDRGVASPGGAFETGRLTQERMRKLKEFQDAEAQALAAKQTEEAKKRKMIEDQNFMAALFQNRVWGR